MAFAKTAPGILEVSEGRRALCLLAQRCAEFCATGTMSSVCEEDLHNSSLVLADEMLMHNPTIRTFLAYDIARRYRQMRRSTHTENYESSGPSYAVSVSLASDPDCNRLFNISLPALVGRHEGCNVQLQDTTDLSRAHLLVTLLPNGLVAVIDLGSNTGVSVVEGALYGEHSEPESIPSLRGLISFHRRKPAFVLRVGSVGSVHLRFRPLYGVVGSPVASLKNPLGRMPEPMKTACRLIDDLKSVASDEKHEIVSSIKDAMADLRLGYELALCRETVGKRDTRKIGAAAPHFPRGNWGNPALL